ncbi:hypothetical protein NDU88_000920 [Pleurodeles waltl]|uniref:Uncharacterized protein n=1 Tax=Pleurodeles waltl TaxID=8319 RepID=A0AAV7V6F2_PLEWA|nr:hypothetical protein NDU88_000920 [Pleurodeles waltl]
MQSCAHRHATLVTRERRPRGALVLQAPSVQALLRPLSNGADEPQVNFSVALRPPGRSRSGGQVVRAHALHWGHCSMLPCPSATPGYA